MVTDFNPYQIIPEVVANRLAHELDTAILLAKKYAPHLVESMEFTRVRYRDTAMSFTGTQNIPSGTKKTFNT